MNDINLPITSENIAWYNVIQQYEEAQEEVGREMKDIKRWDKEAGLE
jgi:hypothetical protein